MPHAFLDFPDAAGTRTPLRFDAPLRVLHASRLDDVRAVLDAVESACAGGAHAVGFVSYEAAPAFDAAMPVREVDAGVPLAWFALFDAPVAAPPDLDDAGDDDGHDDLAWIPDVSADAHAQAIAAIRDGIARGDWYQVNYTFRLGAPAPPDAWAFFRRLRRAQPDAYAAYLDIGAYRILSASPELFFSRDGTRLVTRPMKGTARRGRWLEEDDARARALAASEKERAENVMIVDLLRNDLGRVAVPGSVRVEQLFAVERHPTVLQMTSTIVAAARPDVGLGELFGALFPCGSITGAPKVAAMGAIARLERSARGVYCGAIGHVRPGGDCTFSVAIRTVVASETSRRATYGTGGGVTWDSAAHAEHAEAVDKARILTTRRPAFSLLETMRLEHGAIVRRERHLARLADSARYFDFPDDAASRADALLARVEREAAGGSAPALRVRLTVDAAGTPRVEQRPMEPEASEASAAPRLVRLARTPVRRDDVFLHHKTTHRDAYDARRAEWPDAFDVLLWNAEGEVTEFTIGNVVLALDGVRVTPPRACGLLAGTFRAALLDAGAVTERVVRVEDLAHATAMWLVNSVREWVPVTLAR